METKVLLILVLALSASCEDIKKTKDAEQTKDKRQTQDVGSPQYYYRNARKQEPVAPVEEPQEEDKTLRDERYRPGQVISLNTQELLDLQPERKAPITSQHLQQLYVPQQDQKQSLQQFYYVDPQTQRQLQQVVPPSHAVIARPNYSTNGGEASVGVALSVSDTGSNSAEAYGQDLLALLGHPIRSQAYQTQAPPVQTPAPQYQQIEQYITKPTKKATKLRPKIHVAPQPTIAPQQYLIETTNVQQQQPLQQQQIQQQYHPQQRVPQTLRYVTLQPQALQAQQAVQQPSYERPETQGLKVVPAPNLQNLNPYRPPQYQQENTPKQFRILDTPRFRQEQPRVLNDRPVAYLKRFPEPEKVHSIAEQSLHENLSIQRPVQPEQYYYRSVYRPNEGRRYEVTAKEQPRVIEATKAPLSAIYVSKNIAPKKAIRPVIRYEQPKPEQLREQSHRIEQASSSDQVHFEQGHLDEQRSQLPPPRNNKAYTPEEFAGLIAAGYAVTPIPVGHETPTPQQQQAQSRSLGEPIYHRRAYYNRRNQYLPLRGDDAP
ncbi:mediator of RNA polymerase II transcription subunit 15-like isoform X2 [Pieris rapae]|uniref:mediator of RNA polymerase II transcription subunit 15-like isoform X2 n=1 Tax=Pieris rapae TaxID=64459 RepID=UPI001E280F4C|nr:mediator of RNA polymerase II transcription subunit 15-like isoform X2 [Pieris rapae]